MELETGSAGMPDESSPKIEDISGYMKDVKKIYENFSKIVTDRLNTMGAVNRDIMNMQDPNPFRPVMKYIKRTTTDIEKYKKCVTTEYKDFLTLHGKALSDCKHLKLARQKSEIRENLTRSLESSLRELQSAIIPFTILSGSIENETINCPFSKQNQLPPILLTEIERECTNLIQTVTENYGRCRKFAMPKEKWVKTENDEIPSKRPHLLAPEITIVTESEESNSEIQLIAQSGASEATNTESQSNVESEISDATNTESQSNVESEISDATNTESQSNVESEISDATNTESQSNVESEISDATNTESQSNVESETLEQPIDLSTTFVADCKNEYNVKTEMSETPPSLVNQDKNEIKRGNVEVIDLTD